MQQNIILTALEKGIHNLWKASEDFVKIWKLITWWILKKYVMIMVPNMNKI